MTRRRTAVKSLPSTPAPSLSVRSWRFCGLALAATLALFVAGHGRAQAPADPLSDAPEGAVASAPFVDAASYDEALVRWRGAADINAWIGARFSYDRKRAVALSETQRQQNGSLPIIAARDFFAQPTGVCVDLSRFAVETLRRIDPAARAGYLMIEFDPQTIAGNTLRRHWVASFESGGQRYYFADSKRPGVMAGPYASTGEFIEAYAKYRGRRIVAYRERDSFERQLRAARRASAPTSERDGAGERSRP